MSTPTFPVLYFSYVDVTGTAPVINVGSTIPIDPSGIPTPYLYVPVDKTRLFSFNQGFNYQVDTTTNSLVATSHENVDRDYLYSCLSAALTEWGPLDDGNTTYTVPYTYDDSTGLSFNVDGVAANTSLGTQKFGDHVMLLVASIYNSCLQVQTAADVFTQAQVTTSVTALNQNITTSLSDFLETSASQDMIFQKHVDTNVLGATLSNNGGFLEIQSDDSDMALLFKLRGIETVIQYNGNNYSLVLADVPIYLHLTYPGPVV